MNSLITLDTTPDQIFTLLTVLPEPYHAAYGSENFLRAGRFKSNANPIIKIIIDFLNDNHDIKLKVILGFVDSGIADIIGKQHLPSFLEKRTVAFEEVTLSILIGDVDSGETMSINALSEEE